jgi:protoheme IX farnesyltransferase
MKPAAQAAELGALTTGADAARNARLLDYLALTKPRLNLLVLLTTLGGLYLARPEGLAGAIVLHTMLGTALVAGGAAALNQVWERKTDRLMRRTSSRPMASRRLSVAQGTIFGIVLAAAGLLELVLMVNVTAAWVAAVTLISYVFFYTPLKIRSPLSTLVGAVPGALPPVIGWAGATGEITLPAMVLFGIVFFWQMPHFLAIAWMHRDDYARAGMPLLPVLEPDGRRTGRQALQYALALGPVSLMPVLVNIAGPPYAAVAVLLWGVMVSATARFARQRTHEHARSLFLCSIAYLAVLWTALVVDRLWL